MYVVTPSNEEWSIYLFFFNEIPNYGWQDSQYIYDIFENELVIDGKNPFEWLAHFKDCDFRW